MIIVSVIGPSIKEALRQISGSSRYADMFEVRLDLIHEPFMSRLFAATRKPVIATCRLKEEGGMFEGSEEERRSIFEAAAFLGAAYVDVELSSGRAFVEAIRKRIGAAKLLLSHHDAAGKRIAVEQLYARMRSVGADVLKFAYTANDAGDMRHAIRFFDLAKRDKQKAVAIAMGDCGEPGRILYRKFGGWATYASPEDGQSAAPGQVPACLLRRLYRAHTVTARTKVYGVVGNPVEYSKGIYLHNPLFHRMKRDAVYCRFKVGNVAAFMKYIAPMLSGFSVTLPHKQRVMRYLDEIDPTAQAIGAINTAVRRGRRLIGTNTDAPGALNAIEQTGTVKEKRVLVLGAGGAARAIAFEAKRRGALVSISDRTEAKARLLAKSLGVVSVATAALHSNEYDIFVNATSVGMTPRVNQSPFPKSLLNGKIVFDAVYSPPMTKLLRDAKSVGATIVQGTDMYINQAALQFQLYTGIKPSAKMMKRILQMK